MTGYNKSIAAFKEAVDNIPGGVNSPVRSFKSVQCDPVFIEKAKGSKLWDIDGNEYIDYVGSWGPMILGHAHDDVIAALNETIAKGTSFGAPTLLETELAKQVKKMMPSIDTLRMVNSGTEATMSAIRLARGYTKRNKIIKFEGCYHGHHDSFLIQAGSGALTLGVPNSPGVTENIASDTLIATYNDIDSVQTLFKNHGEDIAALILEPITGNMGVIIPTEEFIYGIESLCKAYGTLLIFDEVMTGFRVAKGGAQQMLGVQPDITTLGKIIGGGLPVGAYGGRKEIMDRLAPQGPVYQAGTLSGNPAAMVAGLTTLNFIDKTPKFYPVLEQKTFELLEGIRDNMDEAGIPGVINTAGSMFTLFFTEEEAVNTFADVCKCNADRFAKYFKLSLDAGVYLAASQFEAGFMSFAHSSDDIAKTIEANRTALKQL